MPIAKSFVRVASALLFASALLDARASDEMRNLADREYEVQHYDRALALYEELATAGDARAAELAGQMLLFGEALYGTAVPRDRARATRWLRQAASADHPLARHLLDQTVRQASRKP